MLFDLDAHGRNHSPDQRRWHWLVLGRIDVGKCFPEVIAEVCSVLADVVRPCCHLRPRCRHSAYIALGNTGNAHKLRLLT